MRYVEPTYQSMYLCQTKPGYVWSAQTIIASTSRDEADIVAKSEHKHSAVYRVFVENVTSVNGRTSPLFASLLT